MKKILFLGLMIGLVAMAACLSDDTSDAMGDSERITFQSEGFKIVGDLYIPLDYETGDKLPAIVITPTASGVKEQTAGIYARKLAAKGLIALAFDHRHWGESEGEPRYLEDPFRKADDIANAVSFMRTRPEVDPERIGGMAICAGASFMVLNALTDKRIKAVGIVSGVFDLQGTLFGGGPESETGPGKEAYMALLDMVGDARQTYFETGESQYVDVIPDVTEDSHPFWVAAYDYFRTERGATPNWENKYNLISYAKLSCFSALPVAHLLSPTPILAIVGTESPNATGSQAFFDNAGEPKEIFWIEGANHQELFDFEEYVNPAVDKLAEFYAANM